MALCLFIAICALFIRGIIYHNHSQPGAVEERKNLFQASRPITLSYHERPPFYITGDDYNLTGLVGQPAVSAFHRSGLKFIIQRTPPQRQLKNIQNNTERTCAVGWFKTLERERFSRFTLPIYQDRSTSVLTRANLNFPSRDLTITELLGLTDLTLLIKSGYSYGKYIDQAIQKKQPNVITTSTDTEQMLNMIAADEADYFFIATEEAEIAIAKSDTPEMFTLLLLSDMPEGNMRHIMCSKLVTEEEISRLNLVITPITAPATTAIRNQ